MSASQVNAATALLKKILPDLAATEITDKREGWADLLKRIQDQKVTPVQPDPTPEADQPAVH